jgi:probable HAF family extracellular repeat protein
MLLYHTRLPALRRESGASVDSLRWQPHPRRIEMRRRARHLTIAAFFGLAVLMIGVSVRGQEPANSTRQTTKYRITDLGTLGGANSVPIWVTNSGEVVGYSETGKLDSSGTPILHAFRWKRGMIQDLGTLGGNNSQAFGANEEGQVAGIADLPGGATSHAVIWHRDAMSDLGTLTGPDGFSYAQLINDRHQVVGGSSTMDGTQHAVVWDHGMITDLGTLGGPNSFANGINERGQIVGGSQVNDMSDPNLGFPPFYVVLWDKGMAMNLGPGPGGIGAAAFNVNNRTQIVGRFAITDPSVGAVGHAFLWESGMMRDLGVPADEQDSEANSLNDNGLIVGDSGMGFIETYAPDRALLWHSGGPIDLNTLIPPGSGYQLIVAFDVNARGEIVVCAVQMSTGNVHAALLTPELTNIENSALSMAAAPLRAGSRPSENARRLLKVAKEKKLGPRGEAR